MSSEQMPWKIGAMESGRIAIDDAQDRQVTGWLEPEDAERILKSVNAHDDLLEALVQCRAALITAIADVTDSTGKQVIERRIATASAAIAKARGEA